MQEFERLEKGVVGVVRTRRVNSTKMPGSSTATLPSGKTRILGNNLVIVD